MGWLRIEGINTKFSFVLFFFKSYPVFLPHLSRVYLPCWMSYSQDRKTDVRTDNITSLWLNKLPSFIYLIYQPMKSFTYSKKHLPTWMGKRIKSLTDQVNFVVIMHNFSRQSLCEFDILYCRSIKWWYSKKMIGTIERVLYIDNNENVFLYGEHEFYPVPWRHCK